MFALFKKPLHEPVAAQRAALARQGPIGAAAMKGVDCDALPGATGPFGHAATNPIPVNGVFGTFTYLAKLRLATARGGALLFHRVGSVRSPVSAHPVDVYETVDVHAQRWDVLYVDPYHPRRSNLAPEGYALMPYDKRMGEPPAGYGVNTRCPDFPGELPVAIVGLNQMLAPLAMQAARHVKVRPFRRPPEQAERLGAMAPQVMGSTS